MPVIWPLQAFSFITMERARLGMQRGERTLLLKRLFGFWICWGIFGTHQKSMAGQSRAGVLLLHTAGSWEHAFLHVGWHNVGQPNVDEAWELQGLAMHQPHGMSHSWA